MFLIGQNGTISLKLDTTLWHGENLKISIYVKKKTPARPLANVWIWESKSIISNVHMC